MRKVNELLTYGIMLDSLVVVYVQYTILLKELQNTNQGLKVFGVASLPHSYWNKPYQTLWMWVSYIFNALEINKYIIQKWRRDSAVGIATHYWLDGPRINSNGE
jgi:hypothetical protein